ncbi:MAG: putative acetoacetate decarboxylase [Candidatus Anoxychlamydiales bacterium]|nr:putative acetoacetate decarboxylase [Candidatus Anoxychlamydiales bacterium]
MKFESDKGYESIQYKYLRLIFWTDPTSLELHPHSLAKVADLPVLEVVSAVPFVSDLTLGYGKVVHDYLKKKKNKSFSSIYFASMKTEVYLFH